MQHLGVASGDSPNNGTSAAQDVDIASEFSRLIHSHRLGLAARAAVDECQALPFKILQVQRQPPIALSDLAGADASLTQTLGPPT